MLVAICRHSWRAVAQHLETELLTGVFPHRSLLYVMGVLSSSGMSGVRLRTGWGGSWRVIQEVALRPHMGRAQGLHVTCAP